MSAPRKDLVVRIPDREGRKAAYVRAAGVRNLKLIPALIAALDVWAGFNPTNTMTEGDTVKFKEPLHDEDPDQLYTLMETPQAPDWRVAIRAINPRLPFPPEQIVDADELIPA